ncbi:adenosylcobalamin-dependent ribonucleoside-diphosphate reductase [Nitrospira moscoviensis]|uniref:Vitamin B12-dependent ribonucleotide reductase n=1 Tax=Nitrospira moscoviensis TaxID=42253 RepID=A0A0K2GBM0_NITMO|nr:adenosylcobalamin-dependent ribonucleoside-diphosphate reductase [Nitrospira moscoviensis]ALA57982.1 Ribonucleoside-diphosphate reductase [Nitrospira moscoviensis]
MTQHRTNSVHEATPESMPLSENALTVLRERYLAKDDEGHIIETVDQLWERVACEIATVETLYGATSEEVASVEEQFHQMLASRTFLPNSPTLMNAGRPGAHKQYSACFVIPIEDDMQSIGNAVTAALLIHKSGGGTGFSFSNLRPKGDRVRSSGGVASGPVSFMKIIDGATEQVRQGGTRRGANMGILHVQHPDILDFVSCKTLDGQIRNFNISVAVTDEFMNAVKEDKPYSLINPRTKHPVKEVFARLVFDRIVEEAWKTGDPGLFFIDRANRACPIPAMGEIVSTNPCGEVPLHGFDACTLGSIDLAKHVRIQPGHGQYEIDWESLDQTIRLAVRFLDNVIDANDHPLPQINAMTRQTRRIGLGIMGYARLLMALGLPYGSEEAIRLTERIAHQMKAMAWRASEQLAKTRGVYPAWKGSKHEQEGRQVRHSYVTTVAPTGSLSMIADTSAGCEPEFALVWFKHVLEGRKLPYLCDLFETTARREGWWHDDLIDRIVANHGSCQGLKEVPAHWQQIFTVAHDLTPEQHVRVQAAWQRFSDTAVSKTINLPSTATVEDVRHAYVLAWELDCSGITVYRDGSRTSQVLNLGKADSNGSLSSNGTSQVRDGDLPVANPFELPDVLDAKRVQVKTTDGHVYVTISTFKTRPLEVFIHTPVEASNTEIYESFARVLSISLRSGVPVEALLEQLEKANQRYGSVASIPAAIIRALRMSQLVKDNGNGLPPCPQCSQGTIRQENCLICRHCGWTKCS